MKLSNQGNGADCGWTSREQAHATSRPRGSSAAFAGNRIMNRKYTYHLLRPGEEEDVYNLVLRVFHRFVALTYTEDGIDTFLNMMSPDSLKEKSPINLL